MHPFFDSIQKLGILLFSWLILILGLCALISRLAGVDLQTCLALYTPSQ